MTSMWQQIANLLNENCTHLSAQSADLEFGEDQADAAYDVVGWGFMGGQGEQLDGEVAGVRAEDETAFVEVDEAEQEGGAAANGVERGLVGAVGGEGVVVAIEDGDGSRSDEWVHGGGLLCVGTDAEEALPVGRVWWRGGRGCREDGRRRPGWFP